MTGLVGFVATVAVPMVQSLRGALAARYLRFLYRGPLPKAVRAVLVRAFTCSVTALRQAQDDPLPHLAIVLSGVPGAEYRRPGTHLPG